MTAQPDVSLDCGARILAALASSFEQRTTRAQYVQRVLEAVASELLVAVMESAGDDVSERVADNAFHAASKWATEAAGSLEAVFATTDRAAV
jgi:hypothetical protein